MPFDPPHLPPSNPQPCMWHVPHGSGPPSIIPVHIFTTQNPGELLASRRPGDRTDPEYALAPPPLRQDREVFGNLLDGPVIPPPVNGGVTSHGRSAVLVPQYGDASGGNLGLGGSQVVIEFKSQDQQGPSTGVELIHLFRESADPTKLQGAQDIVLDQLQGSELELVISWPGYQRERFMIRVKSEKGGPLTRFDLGRQITVAYAFFFVNIARDRLLPNATGFYTIALYQGQNRRQNTPGIQLTQVRLVRFRNTISGSWIAEVEIVL